MKVLILTDEPFPNGMAATNRIKCYARAISEGGLKCEVLIYRRTEVFGKPVRNINFLGEYQGVPFRYISGNTKRSRYVLTRVINDKIDLWRTYNFIDKMLQKGDVLFLYMTRPIEVVLNIIKRAHSKGAFCVSDLCELPFGTGVETDYSKQMRKLTFDKVFPKLDGIISISQNLYDLAKSYTTNSCKHLKVPILVDYNSYYLLDKSSDIDIPFIFHMGTLYQQKDGILGVIEAFGIAVQKISKPIKYILTGNLNDSPHKEEIKRLISKFHLHDRIEFTGYLLDDEKKQYLSKASAVIINKYVTTQNLYCFSTKLGEYLAASKPVIITNVGESSNWLTDRKTAYIVEPNDKEALANAIVGVFDNPTEAHNIGLAGQIFCKNNFDYRNWSKPLIDFLIDLG